MSCEPSRPIWYDHGAAILVPTLSNSSTTTTIFDSSTAGEVPCQILIDQVYSSCGNHAWQVCMPDDFYYDQNADIKAKCWSDAKPSIKIAVERCGCNGATGRAQGLAGATTMALLGLRTGRSTSVANVRWSILRYSSAFGSIDMAQRR